MKETHTRQASLEAHNESLHSTVIFLIDQQAKQMPTETYLFPASIGAIPNHNILEFSRQKLEMIIMEMQRMRELLSLVLSFESKRVSLVGGNHTAARFCTR
ncbi:hypothetical protein VNO80_06355 [Phaseolus coccineus]|uniref:Uncharacterized protein n=1 Tax=Phaseolus coccineus TaxID=3886 RepID=A0AAN9RNT0_PHACN